MPQGEHGQGEGGQRNRVHPAAPSWDDPCPTPHALPICWTLQASPTLAGAPAAQTHGPPRTRSAAPASCSACSSPQPAAQHGKARDTWHGRCCSKCSRRATGRTQCVWNDPQATAHMSNAMRLAHSAHSVAAPGGTAGPRPASPSGPIWTCAPRRALEEQGGGVGVEGGGWHVLGSVEPAVCHLAAIALAQLPLLSPALPALPALCALPALPLYLATARNRRPPGSKGPPPGPGLQEDGGVRCFMGSCAESYVASRRLSCPGLHLRPPPSSPPYSTSPCPARPPAGAAPQASCS